MTYRAKHQKSLDLLSLEQLVESITQFEQGKVRVCVCVQVGHCVCSVATANNSQAASD